ncbi:lysozyme inhibitor LprI family protein [Methylobacterium frigidaeris]|uniref:lysozyme inhibitor LprI family protein n=1 Tax=Methylobacterium frigidaeris TaxID=2038277 RepID=UPI001EDCE704|nr:lysozyme inhibitor LprI family protein [Methylobacterium frigidaeris]
MLAVSCAQEASAQEVRDFPTDDPTLKPRQYRISEYLRSCGKDDLSSVERSICLADTAKKLKFTLRSELQRQAADAAEIEAQEPVGGKTGLERAQIIKRNNARTQKAWEAYFKATCDAIAEEWEIGGGNGGAITTGRCMVRLLVQRINEIRG